MLSVERWENDNIRAVWSGNKKGSHIVGAFYSFHTNGNPLEYALYNLNSEKIDKQVMFWNNGFMRSMKHFIKPEVVSQLKRWNQQGVLIQHERYLEGRKHGLCHYNVVGKERVTEFWYKGVLGIDPALIENPSLITKEKIINERNVEVRRVYLDIIGQDNYLNFFDYEVLDIDPNLNDFLYSIDMGELKVHMVKFICPSTGDVYFHYAPNTCMTVGAVKCWMFGIEGENFTPISEG